jgi:hypothetical protein
VSGVIITIDHFGNLITNIDGELIRELPRTRRSHRRPPAAAAANLRRRPAGGVSSPGEFLRRHRDRPGGAERGRGARSRRGAPVIISSADGPSAGRWTARQAASWPCLVELWLRTSLSSSRGWGLGPARPLKTPAHRI